MVAEQYVVVIIKKMVIKNILYYIYKIHKPRLACVFTMSEQGITLDETYFSLQLWANSAENKLIFLCTPSSGEGDMFLVQIPLASA